MQNCSQPGCKSDWRRCIGVNAACRGLTRIPDVRDWTALSFASKKEGRKAQLNNIALTDVWSVEKY